MGPEKSKKSKKAKSKGKAKTTVKIQTSAGGVIYKKVQSGGPQVALISVKEGKVWTLPKGTPDANESLEEAALREVSEETGLKGELAGKLGEITYWYFLHPENVRCKKTVHFFLMNYISGDTKDHDREVDAAAWFPIGEALDTVSYKGDREMIEKAKIMLAQNKEIF